MPLVADSSSATNLLVTGADVAKRHTNNTAIAAYLDGHCAITSWIGLQVFSDGFSSTSLSAWTLPSPTPNVKVEGSGTSCMLHFLPNGTADGTSCYYLLPSAIKGDFRFEMDMTVMGSPITVLTLARADNAKNIVNLYHHNDGSWRCDSGSNQWGMTVRPFMNSGSYAVPYGSWGHWTISRSGTTLTLMLAPRGGMGMCTTWTFSPCITDDVGRIGVATRFSPGECYWDNIAFSE